MKYPSILDMRNLDEGGTQAPALALGWLEADSRQDLVHIGVIIKKFTTHVF